MKTLTSKDSNGNPYTGASISFQYYSGQSIGSNVISENNTCGWEKPDPNKLLTVTFKAKGAGKPSGGDDQGGTGTEQKDENTICKEKCQSDFNKLSEAQMIAKYEGSNKKQANDNCIAKCDGNKIPYPKKDEPAKDNVVRQDCDLHVNSQKGSDIIGTNNAPQT